MSTPNRGTAYADARAYIVDKITEERVVNGEITAKFGERVAVCAMLSIAADRGDTRAAELLAGMEGTNGRS